ncbi:MAG: exodeoxyribonuclease VII large subunit [Lachnospiraceae bacterium]|nr:exodeoxyribonuclease VII large subunit [Lachnospiraceae bacterium]
MAKTIFRVSQVNAYVKNIFENDYALRDITVRGEVSNCKYHSSGHVYFTMKDEGGSLGCVMFAGKRARGLRFRLEDGQKIIASGSVMVYERTGQYQLYASEIVADGEGDLYKKFEETKKRLEEMGMFAQEYKKPIPRFVSRVGIVTARTGAAIQDIINISGRRNPYVSLYLYPATVQGADAAPTIVKGIEVLDKMALDVIIVGRGGGSAEDLWAFNEESVAKAIFDAETPIISAVGHETDTTIADYAADLRAPTPSAAAELAVFDYKTFLNELDSIRGRLNRLMKSSSSESRLALSTFKARLEKKSPSYVLSNRRAQLSGMENSLSAEIRLALQKEKNRFSLLCAGLSAVSPLGRMSAGYGFLAGEDGKAIKSVDDVSGGDDLRIYIKDGKITASVLNIEKAPEKQI